MNKKIMLFMVVTVILAVVAASLPMPVEGDDHLSSDETEFIHNLSSQITKAGIMVSKYRAWMKSFNKKLLWHGFFFHHIVSIPLPSFPTFGDCGLTGNIPNTMTDIANLWNSEVCSEFNFIDQQVNSLHNGTDVFDFTIRMFQIRGSLNHIESSLSKIKGMIAKLEKKAEEHVKEESTEDNVDSGDRRDTGDNEDSEDIFDTDCFIATAAYGSPAAVEIDILRQFRDEFLVHNYPGRAFVDFYYTTSPPIAKFIFEHDMLRFTVREGFVDPIVAVVEFTESWWAE